MATRKHKTTPISKPPVTGPDGPQPHPDSDTPDQVAKPKPNLRGFQSIGSQQPDGWMQAMAGSWVLGRLLGRFRMEQTTRDDHGNEKIRWFYQIKVTSADALAGVKDSKHPIEIEADMIISIDERKALARDLKPYAESDGVYDLFLEFGEKKKVAGTAKTFWPIDVQLRQVKAPSVPVTKTIDPANYDNSPGDDEIPF